MNIAASSYILANHEAQFIRKQSIPAWKKKFDDFRILSPSKIGPVELYGRWGNRNYRHNLMGVLYPYPYHFNFARGMKDESPGGHWW